MTFAKIPVGTVVEQAQDMMDYAKKNIESGTCDEAEAKEMREWVDFTTGLLRLCKITEHDYIYMDIEDSERLFDDMDL
jgi:D-alanine-D-alanine ligase-like ATP-grasp enzyme